MGTQDERQVKKPGLLRRLYDWTLQWADHPAGPWALFAISFAESSFFPIPPDVLLIALCAGSHKKSFKFAAICLAGSITGGMAGYALGFWGYETLGKPIVEFYGYQEQMNTVDSLFTRYGFMGNLIAAVTPIPYKVFTIASGAFQYPFFPFLLASIVGRALRFFIVASLLFFIGPKVKEQIEKYFDWFAWAFMVLLILGFVALKFLH